MTSDSAFREHTIRLNEPTAEVVREAFVKLPRQGCLEAVCRWERRLELLAALEACGAFAIRFEPADGFASVRIAALKGKSGPCYDTGRRAVYSGGAAAVLDDDSHLIVGEIRVCEKTGGLYALSPYRGALAVTEAEPALLARLDCDPVPFDCNTFDADSRRLLENVERRTSNAERRAMDVEMIYPGPFRALVLADGSVVRRGVAARVPLALAEGSGLLRLPPERAEEARACEAYAAAYRERGAAFLLEPLLADGGVGEPFRPMGEARLDGRALAALRGAPRDIRQRLLQLIDAKEPYWVLTGSDPAAARGCCPSTQVGAANRLAAAGALLAYAPPAPPDACAVTFYAFPGEIQAAGAGASPVFSVCDAIRKQAAEALA